MKQHENADDKKQRRQHAAFDDSVRPNGLTTRRRRPRTSLGTSVKPAFALVMKMPHTLTGILSASSANLRCEMSKVCEK